MTEAQVYAEIKKSSIPLDRWLLYFLRKAKKDGELAGFILGMLPENTDGKIMIEAKHESVMDFIAQVVAMITGDSDLTSEVQALLSGTTSSYGPEDCDNCPDKDTCKDRKGKKKVPEEELLN